MEWMLLVGLIASVCGSCFIIHASLKSCQRALETISDANREMLLASIQSSEQTCATMTENISSAMNRMVDGWKECAPVGGLPRDLWIAQHELNRDRMELQKKQHDLEEPLRTAIRNAKLRQVGMATSMVSVGDPNQ